MMRKPLFLLITVLFLFGCASLKDSEFLEHETMFKSGSHMSFSIWGYKNPSAAWQKLSDEQEWWGIEVPYVPAQ
jgi:hypothetical protein